jgi:hypothetical protein
MNEALFEQYRKTMAEYTTLLNMGLPHVDGFREPAARWIEQVKAAWALVDDGRSKCCPLCGASMPPVEQLA